MAVNDDDGAEPPLKFSNEAKIRSQMKKRRWTKLEIREAMQCEPIPARGQHGPALRYVHPVSGKSVVVDAATGETFHVGREQYRYD